MQQGKLKLLEGEYVDIHNFEDEKLAQALEKLKEIDYLDACGHCSIIENPKIVPPGEQIERGKGEV